MKKTFICLLFSCLGSCLLPEASAQAQVQQSENMRLLSHWQLTDTAAYYNDIWGYSAKGREYAIIGSNSQTHFVDITNPTLPVEVASFYGSDSNVVWRDYKTYSHYAYAVADGGTNSLQIFDLQYLPERVVKVYDSTLPSFSAHNSFIDGNRLYLISNKNQKGYRALEAYSLADPENPEYLGNLSSSVFTSVHDAYVRNNIAYCFSEYKGVAIFDVSDINNAVLLGAITDYPFKGYSHSGWTTEDENVLIFADEVPSGQPLKVYDISDKSNPQFLSTFQSNPGATPHNQFVYGDYVVISYYHDGVQVYDVSDPKQPKRVGFYDTYPENTNYNGFDGCWGVYPYLPSGNIIASDMTHGLFVLTPPYELKPTNQPQTAEVYPNPAVGVFRVKTSSPVKPSDLMLYNTMGRVVTAKFKSVAPNLFELDMPELAQGLYILKVGGGTEPAFQRVLLTRERSLF